MKFRWIYENPNRNKIDGFVYYPKFLNKQTIREKWIKTEKANENTEIEGILIYLE